MNESARYTFQDLDITINSGSAFSRKITLIGVNLSGYLSAIATLRELPDRRYGDPINMAATITDAAGGVVVLSMTSEETRNLDFKNKRYYWDCFVQEPSEEWRRIIGGRATLVKSISR
jgi:hypothetical protein